MIICRRPRHPSSPCSTSWSKEIDIQLLTSCVDWSLDVWQKALAHGLPQGVDQRQVLRRRDRLRQVSTAPGVGAVRPAMRGFTAPTPAVAAGSPPTPPRCRVRTRVTGSGSRHVKRTRSGVNNTSQTYWKRVAVEFDDRLTVDAEIEGTRWRADSTGTWLGDEVPAAIANGWSAVHRLRIDDRLSAVRLVAEELPGSRRRVAPGVDRLAAASG